MEMSSSTSQYSDSFISLNSSSGNFVSEGNSSKPSEDRYTSDSFNSSTESIQEQSCLSRYDETSDSGRRSEQIYDEDTFESPSKDYSSNFSEDESSKDSLESNIEHEDKHQKTFLKMLIENVRTNSTKGSTKANKTDEIQLDSHILPKEVQTYCNRKLHLLTSVKELDSKVLSLHYMKKDDDCHQATLPITKRRLEEMKIENIRLRMKKGVDDIVVHDIKTCPACINTQEEIAQKQFVGTKNTYLKNKLIEEKVQQHLQYQNSVGLIGELAAILPRPSDDPQQIWNRLLSRTSNLQDEW